MCKALDIKHAYTTT